jgi:hypothetical protein
MFPLAVKWSEEVSAFCGAAALVAAVLGAFVVFALLLARLAKHRRPLKPHYLRLGLHSPQGPCPCGRPAAYQDCCRPRDAEALREGVRGFLIQKWSHRSFAGRRQSRPLRDRLETYPLPQVVLPDWVSRPERYSFPIAESALRSWNPWKANLESPPDLDSQSGQSPI